MNDQKDKKSDELAENTSPVVDTAIQSDPNHESQKQESDAKQSNKVVIVTSAVDEDFLNKSLGSNKEKDLQEVLPQLHSKISHLAQGNTYKNDLDLAFNRLLSGADAPEYIAPDKPEEVDEAHESAFEDFQFGMSLGNLETETTVDVKDDSAPDTVPVTPEFASAFEPKSKILGEFSVSELDKLKVAKVEENTDLDGFDMEDFNRLTQTPVPHVADAEDQEILEDEDTVLNLPSEIKKQETTNFDTDPFTIDPHEPVPDYWLEDDE